MEHALEIRNATKKIGKKMIIDDVSFSVKKGEVFGLLGPNGAGKTTIIRMIVGLINMTSGDIFVNGLHIKKQFTEAMHHIGAIVENPELYKFLTGYQNLVHFARMLPDVTADRIDQVIELVKLEDRIDDEVRTYSLGMRQRLGVAQALLHKPSVLILDEPTNGLDPAGIRELRSYLHHLTETEGTTVIVSSHLLSEMELMCDRVAIIQDGRLLDVKAVRQMAENSEKRRVQFEVDDCARTYDLLEQLDTELAIEKLETGFETNLSKEDIANLNQKLVQYGIKVFEIKSMEKTLEERFLEMTGGIHHE
ncbi:ABC transporter ATP-binding protein [Priestia abyssalis]|uniref:ABC transporter ATP-binding protein n=1 Tax=Priestia abyssalis TaxID=1221450 RepID=UPI0009957F4C|nr:ABC transporter ATP-binding protein [Priestia abyssalis]